MPDVTEIEVVFPDPIISTIEVTVPDPVIDLIEVERGIQGDPGPPGADGADGQGVATGGTTGQLLTKASNTDFDTEWTDEAPAGVWGDITGTLSDQLDLQAALDAVTGTFLSSNTARVDPSGNDSTGTIGDLNKPFLTVQGALTAHEVAGSSDPLVDCGHNAFAENLTTSLPVLTFVGSEGGHVQLFVSLTLTSTGDVQLYLINVFTGDITATNADNFYIIASSTEMGSIISSHAGGSLFIQADASRNGVGSITAAGPITAYGLNFAGTVGAPGQPIHISSAFGVDAYVESLVINSPGSNVVLTHSIANEIIAAGTLNLRDSRVIGTNNATSTVYADVLLAGDDTAYDATSWNGDQRTPTKNAVRDKFESLGTASTLASDTDGTLSANSDSRSATQKATKTYVDNAVTGLFDFKGSTNASGNPNYPAASKGDAYVISVAGKVGGASGKSVDIGDVYVASADNAGGTEASVGTSWFVLEHNLVGALLAANNLSDLASASTARTNLGLGALATQSGTFSGTSSGTNTGDAGTVTTLSIVTANGVSGSVANATTTPAVTLALGAITPSSIVISAGTTTVAPLKLSSGTNLTTPVAGSIEFDGTDYYLTV
jgi:hypothetical protein